MKDENSKTVTPGESEPNAPEEKSSSAVPLFIFVFAIPLVAIILARFIWGG